MTDHDDALRQASVPRLGLSAAILVAIAVGGALGTVARFLLEHDLRRCPPATSPPRRCSST